LIPPLRRRLPGPLLPAPDTLEASRLCLIPAAQLGVVRKREKEPKLEPDTADLKPQAGNKRVSLLGVIQSFERAEMEPQRTLHLFSRTAKRARQTGNGLEIRLWLSVKRRHHALAGRVQIECQLR
jgi:hypothetical protein